MKSAYLQGDLKDLEELNERLVARSITSIKEEPSNETEQLLVSAVKELMQIDSVPVNTSYFELGMTSIEVIKLKKLIETLFQMPDMPISTIVKNPTV